ncbi:MAG: polyketide synthase dehydratase domain-containing protein [Syntrophaceae bacterium]|nr:polyketide synthase dehydratase domain-containing protein [Syntrophaceae bacterium]
MEIISEVKKKKNYACDIEIYPYLRDHLVEGKVVLPAVEALIVMAGIVKKNYPQMNIKCLRNAVFSRFLAIEPDARFQPVLVDLEDSDNGGVTASLLTTLKSKKGNISREIAHAKVSFYQSGSEEFCNPPFSAVNKLKGDCISIPSATVYRDLIPFGKSYQNIIGDLSVSPEGALAYISGGDNEADEDLLGSPFPLDAAMHTACVWGQRFAGIVPFPVGFKKRIIYQKTEKKKEYLGRIMPVGVTNESLIFDAWIYKDDVLYESVSGIIMKDVTNGRMKPPEWIRIVNSE